MFDAITNLDQSLFFFFNKMHSPFWDILMSLVTRTEYWLLFFIFIAFYILKNYRLKGLIVLIILALAILVSDQFSVLIKETVKRLRPTHDPAIQQLVHYVQNTGGLYSFFSSHASNTFAVATFTSLLFRNRNYAVLIFLWAVIASYSRIYLGLHYPGDILTGWLLGIFIGILAYKLLSFIEVHFLLLRTPRIAETKLNYKQFRILFITFSLIILTTIIVVNQLMHLNMTIL